MILTLWIIKSCILTSGFFHKSMKITMVEKLWIIVWIRNSRRTAKGPIKLRLRGRMFAKRYTNWIRHFWKLSAKIQLITPVNSTQIQTLYRKQEEKTKPTTLFDHFMLYMWLSIYLFHIYLRKNRIRQNILKN